MRLVPWLFSSVVLAAASGLLNSVVLAGSPTEPVEQIVRVIDGDTVRVAGVVLYWPKVETITVRFACVDAPEMGQTPFGAIAKKRVEQLYKNQQVNYQGADIDRYGRYVGQLLQKGKPIVLQLLREGVLVVDPKFVKDCNPETYYAAQKEAQVNKRGVWNPANPLKEMPWEYRARMERERQFK